MTDAADFQAQIDKASVNFDRLNQIVNGDTETTVAIDSGEVSSFAKLQSDLTTSVSAEIRTELEDEFAAVAGNVAASATSAVLAGGSATAASGSAALASASALTALQAAVAAQGSVHTLTTSVSTGGALPYEVSAITLGTAGSGATVAGEFPLTVAGGPAGHSANIIVSGGSITGVRIVTRGLSTSNTAPTYTLPTIAGLTGATAPTATVSALPDGRVFFAPSSDGLQKLGWQSSAGVIAPWTVGGTQYAEYVKAGVDAAVAVVSSIIAEIQTDAFAMVTVDKDGYLIEILGNDFLHQSPNQTYLLGLINDYTIETDAFAFAMVDKDGYLIELLGSDFLRQSPNQTYLTDLIGHTSFDTDAFAYAIIDSNGYLIDALLFGSSGLYWASTGKPIAKLDDIGDVSASSPSDGDTLSYDAATSTWKAKAASTVDMTPYMPVGDYLAAAIYGQSVLRGFDTTAISTGTFSGGGLLMFNGGMSGFDYSNSANLSSLVAARESGVESAGRGVGESFSQFFNSEAGYAYTADGVSLILSVPAEGGKSAYELSSGGAYFPRLQYMIDAIDTLARAGGKVPDVVHLVYCQGEADTVANTAPAVWYSQIETGIRQPFEAYCQTKFGRKTKVRVIMTQVASHEYYGITDPAIARQVLAMCNTDPNYILAGAMYQYNYGASGVGSHLLNATEVKWAAGMAGRALQRAARGVKHKWVNPLRAWQDGLRTVAIEYDVPVGPLVIDTTNVSDPGQKGFNLYSGATEVAVSAVSIVGLGKRTVLLTTSSDIPTGTIRVDYAHKGGATGQNAGRITGSRGCLRDSDSAVFDPSGINKPLYNWAPIHRIYVG